MVRRLDVSALCRSWMACRRIRGEAWSSWELGTAVNPKINVSEQFWRVFCASRGLRTPLRLTGKTHLVAHPHGGRVLMLQYRENHLLKYPFQKIPMSPQETRERRRLYLFGFNSDEYFTVHLMWVSFFLLSSSLCRVWTYQSTTCTGKSSRGSSWKQFSRFLMLKFRGSAFCRILWFCFWHFIWINIDVHNCFTWAVVNTRWQWS